MSTGETEVAAAAAAAAAAASSGVIVPPAATPPPLPAGLTLVEIKPEKGKVTPNPAYVASRGVSKKAVIVLHEWWGITPAVQKQAVEWFGADCVVIVLDLFRGAVASNLIEAAHLMHALDFTQALRDIKATARYAREKEGCTKVGLFGPSMSGAIAMAAAVHLKDINAAVVLYGIPDVRFASAASLRTPVQFHFGLADVLLNFSDPRAQDQLEAQLENSPAKTKGNVEFYRYEACGHSFAAPEGHTDPAEKSAALKVKERAQQFFQAKLV